MARVKRRGRLLVKEDADDLDECIDEYDEYERGSMSFPILKKRVWIAVSDFTKPEGYEWIPIDEWMPLGGLENFIDCKWIRYEDF